MAKAGLLVFLFLGAQDEFPALLDLLSHDNPATRDDAAERLVQGYAAWRLRLEQRLGEPIDVDLRARIRGVLAEGAWRAQRERFRAALPERISHLYPEFVSTLFSKSPDLRREAVKALAQTFGPSEHPVFPKLFLSPSEARRALPECVAVVDPAPEFQQVRQLWVSVLWSREELLEDPALAASAQSLFEDPVPTVRSYAIWNLLPLVARPANVLQLISRWDILDVNERSQVLDQAARLRMEETYAFFREQLKDSDGGERAACTILHHRIEVLRSEALSYFNSHPNKLWGGTLDFLSPDEATSVLVKKLRDPSWQVTDTLREIEAKGTSEAAEPVAILLNHADGRIRRAALAALARVGTPRQAKAVAAALATHYSKGGKDDDFYDKPGLELLARWDASEGLVGLLAHFPKIADQEEVGAALERLRPPAAVPKLVPWVAGEDRLLAARALGWLYRLGAVKEIRSHVSVVRSIIADPKVGSARRPAAEIASRLGLREIVPILIENRRSPELAPLGPLLAKIWPAEERAALLSSREPGVRECALAAVVAAEGPTALGAVAALASDPEREVRQALAESLANVPGDRAGEILLALARDSDPDVQLHAASSFFRNPRPAWTSAEKRIELLSHPSASIRATTLQYSDGRDLAGQTKLLETLRHDPSQLVRQQMEDPRFTIQSSKWKALEETIKQEKGASTLLSLLYTLREMPQDRTEPLLRALFERVLDERSPSIHDQELEAGFSSHGRIVIQADRVLEDAARIAVTSKLSGLEPLFRRMLQSDQKELQQAGAIAAGGLNFQAAVPRLRELLPGASGDAAAKALGELHAVPLDLFKDPRPEVRARMIQAAQIARDASAFEAVLEATRGLSKKDFHASVKALGELARPETARRLLELMDTPVAEDRKAVLEELRRFPLPELAPAVAEYLDDNYYVVGTAASFLRDAGVPGLLPKAAIRAAKHHPLIAARMAAESGIREAIPELLKWLEVPGNPVMDDTAVEVAEALANLKMREHAPALLAKIRAVPAKTRGRMLPAYGRLVGREAVPDLLGFLAEPPPPVNPYSYEELRRPASLGAAEALLDLGIREPLEKMSEVIRADLMTVQAYRLIARLRSQDLAQEVLATAERQKQPMEGPLALAARVGLPGASEKLLGILHANPAPVISWLQTLWGPSRGLTGWDGWENVRHGTVRAFLSRIEQRTGRKVLLKGPVPEGFHDTIIQGGMLDELLRELPTPWSFYVDEEGSIVADTVDHVRAAWISMLSR